MRYNARGFQNQARAIAENTEPKNGAYWLRLRAENARRAAAAAAARTVRS